MIYLTLNESIVVHFNQVFGISLLFYLISRLISASIGCHRFIHRIIANETTAFFWFLVTVVPDIIGIFIIFHSADHLCGKVIFIIANNSHLYVSFPINICD